MNEKISVTLICRRTGITKAKCYVSVVKLVESEFSLRVCACIEVWLHAWLYG